MLVLKGMLSLDEIDEAVEEVINNYEEITQAFMQRFKILLTGVVMDNTHI